MLPILFALASLALPTDAQRAERYLPHVVLRTQDGKSVRFYEDLVRGKLVVIGFMFTSCSEQCPITTRKLVEVQRRLRNLRSLQFISVSVDPSNDTVARLREFAGKFHAEKNFTFLTGKPAALDEVRAKLGGNRASPLDHTNLLLLGDEASGRWLGIPASTSTKELVRAIRELARSGPSGAGG